MIPSSPFWLKAENSHVSGRSGSTCRVATFIAPRENAIDIRATYAKLVLKKGEARRTASRVGPRSAGGILIGRAYRVADVAASPHAGSYPRTRLRSATSTETRRALHDMGLAQRPDGSHVTTPRVRRLNAHVAVAFVSRRDPRTPVYEPCPWAELPRDAGRFRCQPCRGSRGRGAGPRSRAAAGVPTATSRPVRVGHSRAPTTSACTAHRPRTRRLRAARASLPGQGARSSLPPAMPEQSSKMSALGPHDARSVAPARTRRGT